MSFVGKMLLMAFGFISITTPGALAILQRRDGQSDVICSDDFAWAQNSQGLNPCLVAASVQGACVSTVFSVDKLPNASSHYDVLVNPTACSCSWSAYNLLSACEACQGFELAIQPWAEISTSQQCKPYLSNDTYFPPNTDLEGGRTIPYWATINPQTWQDGAFSVTQAQQLAAEHHPDVNPSASSTKKKKPVGAIAGGVVGGVAVLAIGACIAWMIYRRRRMRSGAQEIRPGGLSHIRSISDLSQRTRTTYYGVQQPNAFAAPSIRTHVTPSVHSMPASPPATASIFSLPVSTRQLASPPPPQPIHLPPPEERIDPYPLVNPPSSPNRPPLHRKGTSDDSTSSAPVSRADEHAATRKRINPPAYSGPTNGSGHRPGHGANIGSLDSQRSWESLESRSVHAVHANNDGQNRTTEDGVHIA